MIIVPTVIEQSGPGVDLSDLPEGLSVDMADPVAGGEYARNAVTLSFDLSVFESVRLAFAATEYGDEPHAPPPGPFPDDTDFDGVAVSADGIDWYEIQDLRSLRSVRFTDYDIDLDAAVAAAGLSFNSTFRIRFCQYDNNPKLKDGFSIHGIALSGETLPPLLHLAMDDSAASPVVADSGTGAQDQTFLDPTGDPNTDGHSVPGAVGTALAFDGVDDGIDISGLSVPIDQDCAIALWYRLDALTPDKLRSFGNYIWYDSGFFLQQNISGVIRWDLLYSGGLSEDLTYPVAVGEWNHLLCQRKAGVIEFYVNGALEGTYSDNPVQLLNGEDLCIGTNVYEGDVAFSMDDLRVYDRALIAAEIVALAGVA